MSRQDEDAIARMLVEHAKWRELAVCAVSTCDEPGTHFVLAAAKEEDCVWFCERHWKMSNAIVPFY